jgi:DNA-binding CsgD family transcriptional regulator
LSGGTIGARATIVIELTVDDSELADQLAALLADVPGLRLAAPGERGDVALVVPDLETTQAEASPLLTPRELDVLMLLAEGASNKTIARRLGISVHTAKFHVGRLLDKLEASGRTDAVTHAARLGVLRL